MHRTNRRSTIKDIARELNLSVSTVSRILCGSTLFNQNTVAQVQNKAKELNYRPNVIARALVKSGSSLIGLIVRDIGHSFFSDIITGVQMTLEEHGYSLILCNSNMNPVEEHRLIKNLLDKCVDGILITPVSTEKINADLYNEVGTQGVPLVMIGSPRIGTTAPSIKVDNVLGGVLAGQHLSGLGHRHFAYLTPIRAELEEHRAFLSTENMERHQGLLHVLKQHQCEHNLAVVEAPHHEVTEQTIDQLLQLNPRPTALFAYSDLMAIHAMRLLERRGLVIPTDLSIIGFDDIEMAALVNPSLTTIAQPKREMGMIGAQKMLSLIQGEPTPAIVLEPELIVRNSTLEFQTNLSACDRTPHERAHPIISASKSIR